MWQPVYFSRWFSSACFNLAKMTLSRDRRTGMPGGANQKDETTALLPGSSPELPGPRQAEFPFIRARFLSVIVPIMAFSALISRDSLLSQYLVNRLARDENKTYERLDLCESEPNSTQVKHSNHLEAQAASLTSHLALVQTIPAFVACLVFGSYSDLLGRRTLMLVPMFTGLLRFLIISMIIRFHLSLKYMYVAYAVDGLTGSTFAVLIAFYCVTADITRTRRARTLSIFGITCLSNTVQAGVSVAISDLIRYLGFFDASLLLLAIWGGAFLITLFLMPETLHYIPDQSHNREPYAEDKESFADPEFSVAQSHQMKVSSAGTRHWKDPRSQLRRLFGFYFFDGTARQRAEMVLLLLIFMFPMANVFTVGSIDVLYQMHRPFCWGPQQIGAYSAIRGGGSNILGAVWLAGLQKYLPFEAIGMLGCCFQGLALGFEAFIVSSWQFYIIPALLIPSVSIIGVSRSLMSLKAKQCDQGALFASIAATECLCNLVSTTSFNQVYSVTLDSRVPGAVYLLMSSCSLTAVLLYGIYFMVRERQR